MEYNKAIRDKIPEIIKADGSEAVIKKLSDSEFLVELEKKLSEEIKEYQESKDVTEIVDVIEVIYRILELKGISKEELEKIRIKKLEERGGFEKNYFLIETKEKV